MGNGEIWPPTYRQNVDGFLELSILLVLNVVIGIVDQGRQFFIAAHVSQLHLASCQTDATQKKFMQMSINIHQQGQHDDRGDRSALEQSAQ